VRVSGQKRKRATHREPRNWQNSPGLCLGVFCMRPGQNRPDSTQPPDLVTQLVECREERRLQRMHKHLQRLHLLVIDELDTFLSPSGSRVPLRVISRAYEHHSLMVTLTCLSRNGRRSLVRRGSPAPCLIGLPTDATSWKQMEKLSTQAGWKEIQLETINSAALRPG